MKRLLMLMIFIAIAAIIVPLHRRLEHWVKHKLAEKNKTIRLEAAKKTIERLGGAEIGGLKSETDHLRCTIYELRFAEWYIKIV